jgi:two-component system nitrogen regulation response regulator GlnG
MHYTVWQQYNNLPTKILYAIVSDMKKADYRGSILVVDDDADVRGALHRILDNMGFDVVAAEDGGKALSYLNHNTPDVILLDVRMPKMGGMEVLKKIKEKGVSSVVIVMTAHADIGTAVQAMKFGAYEFLAKPWSHTMLINAINGAMKERLSLQDVTALRSADKPLSELMGRSVTIERVAQKVKLVAKTDFTVLLEGETGTGKELIANAIYKQSKRCDYPFVVVDCGAIPETLIESELFGHEEGAFTGAHRKHDGYFFFASHGTIFLDEISNLSLTAQNKLLRVLEERKIYRVGSERPVDVDARVVAASNHNLNKEVEAGKFKLDLYHRLKEFYISLPPLRERREDIIFLAERFIKETSAELKKNAPKLSGDAAECIFHYHWPGNVRELRNTIRAGVLVAEDTIKPEHLNIESNIYNREEGGIGSADLTLREASRKATAEAEMKMIQEALKASNGNKSKAAKLLKIDYKTLYNKMKSYGI